MFREHNAHERNRQAMVDRRNALIQDGVNGLPFKAKCAMAPGTDTLTVQRLGPRGLPSTLVGVTVETQSGTLFVNLTPSDARRMAQAMLDAADEADGTPLLEYATPETPVRAAAILQAQAEERGR